MGICEFFYKFINKNDLMCFCFFIIFLLLNEVLIMGVQFDIIGFNVFSFIVEFKLFCIDV